MKYMMKNAFAATTAAFLLVSAGAAARAADAAGKGTQPRKTLAQHRAEMIAAAGGLIEIPAREPGVRFADGQKSVPREFVEECAKGIKDLFRVNVSVVEEKFTSIDVLAQVKPISGRGALIALCEMPHIPALLVAPDSNWAVVNVTALKRDNPTEKTLAARLRKQMWRAFAQTMGSGWSTTQGCILKPASTNVELDAITGRTIGPDAAGRIFAEIKRLNMPTGGTCTYLQACQEGWAPAPTNAAQKAVWQKVHEMPAEPLKILPEKTKVEK